MTIPTLKPVEKNKFVPVVNSRGERVTGLYRRNNRLYYQSRVSYRRSPVKIPLAAKNLREADKEIIETKARLNKGEQYQDAKWVEVKVVETPKTEDSTENKDQNGFVQFKTFSPSEVFQRWLEVKQARVEDSSKKCSEDDLQAWEEAFNNNGIGSLKTTRKKDIGQVLEEWEKTTGKNKVSRYRMRKRLATLRRVFSWLKFQEIIPEVPWTSDDASEWIGKTEPKQARPLLTKEQVKNIIKTAREDKGSRGHPSFGEVLADIIETMTHTGLRRMEAFSLRWRQIDFKNKQVIVEKEKRQQSGTIRTIPFLGDKNQAEKFFKKLRNKAKRTGSFSDDGFVFVGRNKVKKEEKENSDSDNNTHVRNLTGLLIRVAEKLEMENFARDKNREKRDLKTFPHLGFHDFRRYFITKCLNARIEANLISAWCGHKDGGQLVRNTYAKYDEAVARKMAKLVKY